MKLEEELKNVYVYRHRRLDNNQVFYVGISKIINYKRAYSKNNRNIYWKRIVDKTNYNVEILAENLSWKEACELEQLLIQQYGRKDNNTGILCNMTDGGDGINNKIWTKESRKKSSISSTGKKMSKEAKEKMSKFWRNSKNSNRSHIILDTQTGVFYNSLKEASQYYRFSYSCLVAMILGQNPNKSNLIYV
jgi:hypothetical protein